MSHKKSKNKHGQNKGYNQNQQANSSFNDQMNAKYENNSNAQA